MLFVWAGGGSVPVDHLLGDWESMIQLLLEQRKKDYSRVGLNGKQKMELGQCREEDVV